MGSATQQGQGRFTPTKISHFEAIFKQNVATVAYGIGSENYFHFDLNAGSGWNAKADCMGSPLAFRAAAVGAGMPSALSFCCELNEGSAKKLSSLVASQGDGDTYVVTGANQAFVDVIPDVIRGHGVEPSLAYGSILIDPNDQNRDAIPYEGLRRLTKACPRLDVVFHFPQLAIKRILGGAARGTIPQDSRSLADCFSVDDLPKVIGKRHLWIAAEGLGNFAIIVGRNTPNINSYKKTGLFEWDSPRGVYYRNRCKMPVGDAERLWAVECEAASGQGMLFPEA